MKRLGTVLLAAMVLTGCDTQDEGVAMAADAPGDSRAVGSEAPTRMFVVETPAEAAPETGPQQQADAPRDAANQTVDESRRTAIVRAASRVSPGVATISVISSRQVRSRDPFDWWFGAQPRTRRTAGYGSGFVVDGAQGIVITNEHVVRGAERVQVTLPDGNDYPAEVVGADAVTDVAVLRVDTDEPLPAVPLGTSEGLYIGEWVVAIGNPFGNLIANAEPSVTTGVVSATGRHIIPQQGAESLQLGMIQTDAAINPGNSGGPLVNVLGQVVGVNASIFSRSGGSEGLGFAIPIDRALRIAEDLLEFGEVRRAWLGIDVEAAEADDWGRTRGVIVSRVVGRSPAAEAGLVAGRQILSVNGHPVYAPLDWEDATLDLRPGDEIAIRVEGSDIPIRMAAGTLPSMSADRVQALESLEMVTVDAAIANERGLSYEEGALIAGISAELSSALGLRDGDVLLQIGNVRVTSAEQAADLFRQIRENFRGRSIQLVFERNGGVTTSRFILR
ncbi:MAG TPA: trypsin-like peptidase domain-containing protein [Longimicrobiales bacterium]|nr:trypsin-like peptidase domain-containing protein [Longimicrobiales bacterium]